MSKCSNFNDLSLFDKLTDTMSLCLALERPHKRFLNLINLSTSRSRTQPNLFLLHRSSLVSSSAGRLVIPRAVTRVRARNQHQIFMQISVVDISQNPPRSFKISSHSSEVSGIEPAFSQLYSQRDTRCFPHVSAQF